MSVQEHYMYNTTIVPQTLDSGGGDLFWFAAENITSMVFENILWTEWIRTGLEKIS